MRMLRVLYYHVKIFGIFLSLQGDSIFMIMLIKFETNTFVNHWFDNV